jgi:hypothetical protein
VELKCPSCAKLTTEPECPRCGSDLSLLLTIRDTAADDLTRAAMLLRQGHSASALTFACQSWEKIHSRDAAKLAFIAALGTGDFASASYWHAQAQGPQ